MKSKGFLRSTSLLALLFIVSLIRSDSSAQSNPAPRINPELLTKVWSARWITVPNTSPFDYGVYHFRKIFELPAAIIRHSRHRRQPISALHKRGAHCVGTGARRFESLAL
jgi:hypothetical protein